MNCPLPASLLKHLRSIKTHRTTNKEWRDCQKNSISDLVRARSRSKRSKIRLRQFRNGSKSKEMRKMDQPMR